MQRRLSEGFFKRDVMRNFAEFARKNMCRNLFFGVFLVKITFFAEKHQTTASEYSSINSSVGSTVLVNETVNYDTKAKAYLLICVRSVKLLNRQLRLKNRFQKQSFTIFKLGVLKNFVNSLEKHLCRSLFLIKLQTSCNSIKKKFQHKCFPVKFTKFLRIPFLQNSSSGCF